MTRKNARYLTDEEICYIRNNPQGLTQQKLAEDFQVTQPAISLIQRGISYPSVVCK